MSDKTKPVIWADYNIGLDMPADWVHVLTLDGSDTVEWSTLHAFYSSSARRYFWHGAVGCSCNCWSEELDSLADFENGEKTDLERALRRFGDTEYGISAEDMLDALADLRRFKPAAVDHD